MEQEKCRRRRCKVLTRMCLILHRSLLQYYWIVESRRSSNNVTTGVNIQFQQQPRKCKLLSWQRNVVAEATIASTDPTVLVHHVPLGADTWKVWVDAVVDPEALLFGPTSDIYTIGQAVGTSIA